MKVLKIARALLLISAIAMAGGCAGTFPPRSEVPVTEAQIAGLPLGIDRSRLLQRLGPPAEESAYERLHETVLSWRLEVPGAEGWLFNAHLDPSGRVTHYSRALDPITVGGPAHGW